jgi:hypothetical protein
MTKTSNQLSQNRASQESTLDLIDLLSDRLTVTEEVVTSLIDRIQKLERVTSLLLAREQEQ